MIPAQDVPIHVALDALDALRAAIGQPGSDMLKPWTQYMGGTLITEDQYRDGLDVIESVVMSAVNDTTGTNPLGELIRDAVNKYEEPA